MEGKVSHTQAQMRTHRLFVTLSHAQEEIHCFLSVQAVHGETGRCIALRKSHTPLLFLTRTRISLHVYHDDPCHKGEALNKTRVIGGGEDAKITKQLKPRPRTGAPTAAPLLTVWRTSTAMSFHGMIDGRAADSQVDPLKVAKFHKDFHVTVFCG